MTGTLTHRPNAIMRQLLIDQSLGSNGDTTDWPVYAGREPDTPDNVITVYNTSPVYQGRFMTNGEVQERPGIMIRVRGTTEAVMHTKIDAIRNALDKSINIQQVNVSTSIYIVHSVSRTSGPIFLGKDLPNSERNAATLNVTVALTQDS